MNLSAYNMNLQYQRTELSYEMSISKVGASQKEQELLEAQALGLEASNLPVIYMDEKDLSSTDMLRKLVLEASFSQYSSSQNSVSLFPYASKEVSNEPSQNVNPYRKDSPLPNGFVYGSSQEYYERTTIDFNAQLRIVTPEGEYNVELKFSYAQEYYEKNETMIQVANENMKKPLEVHLDKDEPHLKELKSLHFLFELLKEDRKELREEQKKEALESIKDGVEKRKELQEDSEDKKVPVKENFQVWLSQNESKFDLVAMKQEGMEVFFANSVNESSFVDYKETDDGYSLSAGYSYSESSYMEIKA